MIWDDEKIKQLKKLWEKGLSTTEIAKKMNVSKNSVVGKVHRLCLKARPSPIKKRGDEIGVGTKQNDLFFEQDDNVPDTDVETIVNVTEADNETFLRSEIEDQKSRSFETETKKETEQKLKANKKTCNPIRLVELDSHTCRWPIGDPRDDDFCFCGKKVHAGQTYCDEHSQVAYVKAGIRK